MKISILYQATIKVQLTTELNKHTCSFQSYRNKEHLKVYIFYGSLYTNQILPKVRIVNSCPKMIVYIKT